MSEILLNRADAVLTVTLNRPDQLNAFTAEMEQRYLRAVLDADADPEVRVIVVTGAGRGFCAGADMSMLAALTCGELDGVVASMAAGSGAEAPLSKLDLLELRTPLIAAVNGPCVGLGFVHALYCDLRIGGSKTRFATAFARRGLAAEYGMSWLLPRVVGHSRALDLLLSGRTVDGAEAARIGLVDVLAPAGEVLQAALSYAHELVENCSPSSMASIKSQLLRDSEGGLRDAHDRAEQLMLASFASPDAAEGVRSWLEKRPPRFRPVP